MTNTHLSLKRCQSMMKSDVAFQSEFINQPIKKVVRSNVLKSPSSNQSNISKRKVSVSNNRNNESDNEEFLFFD